MQTNEWKRWYVIGALALSTLGGCDGHALATPESAGSGGQAGHGGAVPQDGAPACGCDATTPPSEGPALTAHQPLACGCGAPAAPAACTATLRTFDTNPWCSSNSVFGCVVRRITGCGRVSYQNVCGYGASQVTFDAATGALVGEAAAGDIQWGACNVHGYEWGTTSTDCADNVSCTVCGCTACLGDSPPACP